MLEVDFQNMPSRHEIFFVLLIFHCVINRARTHKLLNVLPKGNNSG